MELPYEQGDFRAMETIYGFENESPTVQEIGKVVTKVILSAQIFRQVYGSHVP